MSPALNNSGWLTRHLRKAWALSWTERLLLLESAALLLAVELGLKLLPLKNLMALLETGRSVNGTGASQDSVGAERMAYLLEIASRYLVPKATCLKKSLALYGLLNRKGIPAKLVIGAAKADGRLDAHAWVEHQGRVLTAGPSVERYARLGGFAVEDALAK